MKQAVRSLPLIFAILVIALYRLIPHPWNFTPVCAAAIFGGLHMPRWGAFTLPLASMIIADLFIGMDWIMTPVIYVTILMTVFVGIWAKRVYAQRGHFMLRLFGGTMASSIMFYLITNFVSWLTLPQYTKDIPGLIESYVMAVPFFGNALIGDTFFVALFALSYEMIRRFSERLAPSTISAN